MVNGRRNEWQTHSQSYSPDQVESVLDELGIDIAYETDVSFIGYCPFHGNRSTPAFSVSQETGWFNCFNPACGVHGSLYKLIQLLTNKNFFEANRLILKYENNVSPIEQVNKKLLVEPEFVEFSQELLDNLKHDLWSLDGEPAVEYLHGRGFTDETLNYFDVGYSLVQEMTTVPMHDPKGMPIGVIGRSLEGKRFKNSKDLPKAKTAWNFHRAKLEGDTVIVVESSFDAMRVWQAGYKNVIALLGGSLSEYHKEQLNRTFSTIIIMTDFDERQEPKANCRKCSGDCVGHRPGRELGRAIANELPHKKVRWAAYDNTCVYPHHAKDVGDMTDVEIRKCLRDAVSNFDYLIWDIENADLVSAR